MTIRVNAGLCQKMVWSLLLQIASEGPTLISRAEGTGHEVLHGGIRSFTWDIFSDVRLFSSFQLGRAYSSFFLISSHSFPFPFALSLIRLKPPLSFSPLSVKEILSSLCSIRS